MHFKQAETLDWIEQMQAAMAVVVDQCGDLRKQLPSSKGLPPPPKVELPPPKEPEKPTLAKRLSISRKPSEKIEPTTPSEPQAKSVLKPLTTTTTVIAIPEPELKEISDAQRVLGKWKESKERVDEIDGSMNEVLVGMRELRMSPRLGEATRAMPPPPPVVDVVAPAVAAPAAPSR
jgi:hypothetical protein